MLDLKLAIGKIGNSNWTLLVVGIVALYLMVTMGLKQLAADIAAANQHLGAIKGSISTLETDVKEEVANFKNRTSKMTGKLIDVETRLANFNTQIDTRLMTLDATIGKLEKSAQSIAASVDRFNKRLPKGIAPIAWRVHPLKDPKALDPNDRKAWTEALKNIPAEFILTPWPKGKQTPKTQK